MIAQYCLTIFLAVDLLSAQQPRDQQPLPLSLACSGSAHPCKFNPITGVQWGSCPSNTETCLISPAIAKDEYGYAGGTCCNTISRPLLTDFQPCRGSGRDCRSNPRLLGVTLGTCPLGERCKTSSMIPPDQNGYIPGKCCAPSPLPPPPPSPPPPPATQNCGDYSGKSLLKPSQGFGIQSLERYYYDSSIHSCLIFKYLGQGGDGNNFKTHAECSQRCIYSIADYQPCTGSGKQCSRNPRTGKTSNCPDDEYCQVHPLVAPHSSGRVSGQCCSQKVYEEYRAAENGDCGFGRRSDGIKIGRECSKMPCDRSTGQTCRKANANFSFCCPL